jgi:hypothetical protein
MSVEVIYTHLGGDELLGGEYLHKPRFIIDFGNRAMDEAARFKLAFDHLKRHVLPDWQANAEKERQTTGKESGEHQNRLRTWWLLKRPREQMLAAIEPLPRYIACVRHTKRPIFEFLASRIRPDSALTVFAFADDYSFGLLQSGIHWAWFTAKCSTLTARFRYTSDTVFDTFPWPQYPESRSSRGKETQTSARANDRSLVTSATRERICAVADAARALRTLRREIMDANGWSLRALYRSLELPGESRLRDAHAALDTAVRAAYGMKPDEDILAFLLKLNLELAGKEAKGEAITPPGLPAFVANPQRFVSGDCVRVADERYSNGSTAQSYADAAHFYSAKEEPPEYR